MVADTIGTTEGAVEEVVKKAIQVGFFNKEMFDKYKILTSNGIQNRFKSAVTRREEIEYVVDYLVSECKTEVIAYKNEVIDDRSTQSKVKVKRKKTKETSTDVEAKKAEQARKLAAAKAATLSRKDAFYKSLVPYVERYGRDMVRDFFDYWSEMNKSETKMRFEQQTTWEVGKRLATWEKREKINGKPNYSVQPTGTYTCGRTSQDKAASRQSLENLADAILGQH